MKSVNKTSSAERNVLGRRKNKKGQARNEPFAVPKEKEM